MSIENISNSKIEEDAASLFKSERSEDMVAILLAALLVVAVLFGLRV